MAESIVYTVCRLGRIGGRNGAERSLVSLGRWLNSGVRITRAVRRGSPSPLRLGYPVILLEGEMVKAIYKGIGNGQTVNVMRWLAERIKKALAV